MCCGLASCLICCTCNTCCRCKETSTKSKVIYVMIFLLAILLGIFFRYWGDDLKIEWTDFYSFDVGCTSDRCFGIQAVYRISFATAVFFLAMTLLTLCSATMNRGGWGLKFLLFIALVVVSFFIPNDFFTDGYSWVSRIGSIVFLVLQVNLLLDFAFDLSEYLQERIAKRDEEIAAEYDVAPCMGLTGPKAVYLGLSFLSVGGSLAAIIIMFILFPDCSLDKFFISSTLLLGLFLCATSVGMLDICSSKAREAEQAGLLPAGFVWAYITFLLWGALTNNPDEDCNDFANDDDIGRVIIGVIITAFSIVWASVRAAHGAPLLFKPGAPKEPPADAPQPVGATASTPAAITSASTAEDKAMDAVYAGEEGKADDAAAHVPDYGAPKEKKKAKAKAASAHHHYDDDEADGGRKNMDDPTAEDKQVWVFHLVLFFAALYLGMALSNWGTVDGEGSKNPSTNTEQSKVGMWVKIVSAWFTAGLFGWILVAPTCCPSRDFTGTHNQFRDGR